MKRKPIQVDITDHELISELAERTGRPRWWVVKWLLHLSLVQNDQLAATLLHAEADSWIQ